MRILLIEDDSLIQKALVRMFKGSPLFATTDVVDNASDAVRQLDKIAYDYIVSDFDLNVGPAATCCFTCASTSLSTVTATASS